MRKRLSVGMMLALFSQITGINTVLYYGSIIIKEHFPTQSTSMALVANVIIGTVNLIFTIVAMIYLDRWGRRAILMMASGGMGISLTLLVVGLNLHNISPVLMLSSILLYVSFFALGMGPGPWLIMSEIFPTRIRSTAMATASVFLWLSAFVAAQAFAPASAFFQRTMGSVAAVFWIFAAICLSSFIFSWRMVPETKGRSLEEIGRCWSGSG